MTRGGASEEEKEANILSEDAVAKLMSAQLLSFDRVSAPS
jgi:hypothetical protein